MQLRKSTYDDVESVCRIIAQAQSQMRRLGIDQWQNGYPDRNSVLADVEAGVGYVMCEADTVIACGAVIFGADPNYARIEEGEWITEGSDYVTCVRKYAKHGRAVIDVPDARIELRVEGVPEFEVFTGTAPGIPSSLSSGPDLSAQECYPVIVRVHAASFRVEANWKFLRIHNQ